MITIKKSIRMLPTQLKVLASESREILYSGGYGSGKSIVGCWAMLREISVPNSRVLILRKTLTSLKKSTMVTMFSITPRNSYVFNKSDAIMTFNNGSQVYFMGLDDPERIKSTEFGACFIDEASELNKDEYETIKFRVRLKGSSRRIYLCTNPSTQGHWIYKRFYEEKNKHRVAFTASSRENLFLPKDYLDELNQLDGARGERLRDGRWINLDNMIFDIFDREKHVKHLPDIARYEDYVIGLDYGYTHYTGILVCGITNGRIFVIDEFYRNRLLIRDIVEQVRIFASRYKNATFVYDPSAAGLGAELENMDLLTVKADNDVIKSIDRIRNRLRLLEGESDLVINDNCTNLVREMEEYQYQPGTEKPKKVKDDLIDPLRYIVGYVDDMKNSYIYPKFAGLDEKEEEDTFLYDIHGMPLDTFE